MAAGAILHQAAAAKTSEKHHAQVNYMSTPSYGLRFMTTSTLFVLRTIALAVCVTCLNNRFFQ